jgi:hypothetical protein
MVTVKIDDSAVKNAVFNQKKLITANVNTINQLARISRTGVQSQIYSDFNIPAEIPAKDKNLAIEKASAANQTALIIGSKKKMRLGAFPSEDTAQGVKVFVKKGRGSIAKQRGNANKSFLGTPHGKDYSDKGQTRTSSNGKRMVLIRRGPNAYPISTKNMNGPSMGNLLTKKAQLNYINRTISQRGSIILDLEQRKLGIK